MVAHMTFQESVADSTRAALEATRIWVAKAKAACSAKVRQADNWLEQRHASRSGRLTHRMVPGLANAGLLAVVATLTSIWADGYYSRLGFTLSDARPSFLRLAMVALAFAAVLVLIYMTIIWVSLTLPGTPGTKVAATALFIVVVVGIAGALTNGAGATVALLVVVTGLFVHSVQRKLVASHRMVLFAKVLAVVVLFVAILIATPAAPLSYEQIADGHPSSIANTFLPLPDDFVVDRASDSPRPLVVLDRSAWMTVIDPCSDAPYEKQLVRFDQVELEPASFDEAMSLCRVASP